MWHSRDEKNQTARTKSGAIVKIPRPHKYAEVAAERKGLLQLELHTIPKHKIAFVKFCKYSRNIEDARKVNLLWEWHLATNLGGGTGTMTADVLKPAKKPNQTPASAPLLETLAMGGVKMVPFIKTVLTDTALAEASPETTQLPAHASELTEISSTANQNEDTPVDSILEMLRQWYPTPPQTSLPISYPSTTHALASSEHDTIAELKASLEQDRFQLLEDRREFTRLCLKLEEQKKKLALDQQQFETHKRLQQAEFEKYKRQEKAEFEERKRKEMRQLKVEVEDMARRFCGRV